MGLFLGLVALIRSPCWSDTCVMFQKSSWSKIVLLFGYPPVYISKEVLIVAWACCKSPIVWTWLVVACFKLILTICATSWLFWELKTDPLSVVMIEGMYAYCLRISMITFAVDAVGSEAWYTNVYSQKNVLYCINFQVASTWWGSW